MIKSQIYQMYDRCSEDVDPGFDITRMEFTKYVHDCLIVASLYTTLVICGWQLRKMSLANSWHSGRSPSVLGRTLMCQAAILRRCTAVGKASKDKQASQGRAVSTSPTKSTRPMRCAWACSSLR